MARPRPSTRSRRSSRRRLRRLHMPQAHHPAQIIAGAFLLAVAIGTAALMLPLSRADGRSTGFLDALFTATSAVCVTGLAVVDTGAHWSTAGQAILLVLVQVGGLGIMTLTTLIGLLLARRIGLRSRLTAAAEGGQLGLGDVRSILLSVLRFSVGFELAAALALAGRFWLGLGEEPGRALWLGTFHAVAAFNHAGFALWSDGLVRFASDPWICIPLAIAIVAGSLGFPVLLELSRRLRAPRRLSLNTRLVLWGTALLLPGGWVLITALEWDNAATLGALSEPGKILAGLFASVNTRSAGFNSVDIGAMRPATLLVTDVLMFIGGGPAGTAGGIRITTFAVLFFVMWAEVRGEEEVDAFGRAIPRPVHRQALTVALLSVGLIVAASLVLMQLAALRLDEALFEVVSAFSTTGLSTGVTGELPDGGKVVLVVLMFLGRIGPVTIASALALRERHHLYRLPQERPIIG